MSTVGSSDGSNRQDEVVRRNREDYNKKESEIIKKHQRELKRINEQHYQELEKLKASHQAQMADMQRSSTDSISARDHRYQKEVEELRNMHRNQLKAVADENQRKEELVTKSTKGDVTNQQVNAEKRFEQLNMDYQNNIKKLNEQYEQNLVEARESQAEAIGRNREKLKKAHDLELDLVKDERNKSVSGLQKEYDNHRQFTTQQIKDQEVRHFRDKNRQSENLIKAVRSERINRNDSEQVLREGFDDGIQKVRERFEAAAQKSRMDNHQARENANSVVNDRVDGQLRRLEVKNEDLLFENQRNERKLKIDKQREIASVKDSYQKNVEAYKEQRDEIVRQAQIDNRRDVEKVNKTMGKQLIDTNRFYRDRMDEQNRINRTAIDNMTDDYALRNESSKTIADQRVKRMHEETEAQKSRLLEQTQDNHTIGRRQHAEEIKNLRDQMDSDKRKAVASVQEQMKKQEMQNNEKISVVVQKYEKQVTALQDQLLKEKKANEENLKRTVEEMQRAHKLALDQVDSRNRDQLRQTNVKHAEELRTVNKRHDEKLDQVLVEVKKS